LTAENHPAIPAPAGFRGTFRDDPAACGVYSEAAGIERIIPQAVAVPVDADDVVTLVRWARGLSLPITPRGSGTSMAGGAIGPGVICDLSSMNGMGDVDLTSSSIRVGPGALRSSVNEVAMKSGLRFPVDPSSGAFCTIGGMVSTNAAGAHSLLFGATRPWVRSLDCVFADGSVARVVRGEPPPMSVPAIRAFFDDAHQAITNERKKISAAHRGVRKDSSGYALNAYAASGDLIDILVGSEGTLAIVVGVELSLMDLPRATSGVLGAFRSLDDAVSAAASARELGAAACELLEKTFLDVAASGHSAEEIASDSPANRSALSSLPEGTAAVLLAEVEGESEEATSTAAEALADKFRSAGATHVSVALTPGEQHEIWDLRHAASPILSQLNPVLKAMQFVEDGAVPPEKLADYVRGVRAALDSHGVRGVIFGHAGDGNVHVNPLIDVSQSDWRQKVEGILEDVVMLTSRLGGTLTGEHGDGRLRAPLMVETWPEEEIRLFALVKTSFDPDGALNPGVKIPLGGQRPIADVKYDPSLPTLVPAARAALDFITAERAYATSRLSLLERRT
jgi:FAD/FMN-containing dehydrogenase